MSPATLAYLARLEVWALAAAIFEGGLVWLSWLAWARAVTQANAGLRHRLACAHFAALLALPALTVAVLQWTIVAVAVAPRGAGPAPAPPSLMAGYRSLVDWALPLGIVWLAGPA